MEVNLFLTNCPLACTKNYRHIIYSGCKMKYFVLPRFLQMAVNRMHTISITIEPVFWKELYQNLVAIQCQLLSYFSDIYSSE